MDDDDDIEFLRLAALKSLNAKKEPELVKAAAAAVSRNFHRRNNHQSHSNRRPILGNAIQVLDNLPPPPFGSSYTSNGVAPHRHFSNNNNNGPLLADPPLNEPYASQRIGMNGKWIDSMAQQPEYAAFVPMPKVCPPVPNVQLSPRSAAFVSQNNDILKRRKGGHHSPPSHRSRSPLSPQYRSRTPPSPEYRSNSPGYASLVPKFNTNLSSSTWSSRRSVSRSPPPFRRLSPGRPTKPISRSPPPPLNRRFSRSPKRGAVSPAPRSRYSPALRRSLSRSPPHHRNPQLPSNRMHSRSPPLPPPPPSQSSYNRRPLSPQPRNTTSFQPNHHKDRRGHSPAPIASHHQSSNHRSTARHMSPVATTTAAAASSTGSPSYRSNMRRRTRSPIKNQDMPQQPNVAASKRRSDSRSPMRKYSKPTASRDRPIGGHPSNKRRSPANRKNSRNGSSNSSVRGNQRARALKRSASPAPQAAKRRASRSPQPTQVRNVSTSNGSKSASADVLVLDENTRLLKIGDNTKMDTATMAADHTTTAAPKSQQELEDELLASTDDDGDNNDAKSDKDDDHNNNDDEIDLFASEESESENEGRFKSSSSRNERPTNTSTVSFSRLGNASASMVLLDLNDVVKSDKSFGSGERTTGNRRGDRHDDRYHRGARDGAYSTNRARDDRYRSRNSGRNDGRNSTTNKSKNSSSKNDDRKKDEKSMFKSTFQSVDSTTKDSVKPYKHDVASSCVVTTTAMTSVKSSSRDRDRQPSGSGEKRSVIQLKRPNVVTLKEPEREKVQLSSKISAPCSSVASAVAVAPPPPPPLLLLSSLPPASVAAAATMTTTAALESASATSSDDGTTSKKKAIHLRLGAMTKTWKNKKSWRSEKPLFHFFVALAKSTSAMSSS